VNINHNCVSCITIRVILVHINNHYQISIKQIEFNTSFFRPSHFVHYRRITAQGFTKYPERVQQQFWLQVQLLWTLGALHYSSENASLLKLQKIYLFHQQTVSMYSVDVQCEEKVVDSNM
jgi:hypothetical protein